jgi:glycosyltransferase involved in cell wall biosynthesis
VKNKAKISGLVLTHNSEGTLEECLKSLQWVDEIVLIDDNSSDRTIEIATKYNVRVLIRKLDDFSSQRNFGLENCNNDWVLVLDSDEQISDALQKEIKSILNQPIIDKTGFQIPRKNFFMGTWIRSIYPDYCLRLFRRSQAGYRGAVHERLNINGEIGKLKHPILHISYTNIEQILQKTNHYTTLSAQELYEKGKKATFMDIILRPVHTFIKIYFFKGGFLDGIPGLILHILSGYYTFIKYIKLYFLGKKNRTLVTTKKRRE